MTSNCLCIALLSGKLVYNLVIEWTVKPKIIILFFKPLGDQFILWVGSVIENIWVDNMQ